MLNQKQAKVPWMRTSVLQRLCPAASTVGSYDSKESSDSRNRSPSPYYLSGLNKHNPNPLFKELITDPNKSTSGSEFRASEVGKKTEYSRRITSKLRKPLREIESDLNSCQLAKTGSEISVDGVTAALLLGTGDGIGVGNSGTRHSLSSPVIISKAEGNSGNNVNAKNDGDHDHATK
ncbi:unnamed protein product [Orchesella dallaii]|uniref:Uncharacterized protein n=1 Tax=Orchesella dallaii TaxID=48710 RepID=A0ABP1RPW4_9HEXA